MRPRRESRWQRRCPEEPDVWPTSPVPWEGSRGNLGPLPDTRPSTTPRSALAKGASSRFQAHEFVRRAKFPLCGACGRRAEPRYPAKRGRDVPAHGVNPYEYVKDVLIRIQVTLRAESTSSCPGAGAFPRKQNAANPPDERRFGTLGAGARSAIEGPRSHGGPRRDFHTRGLGRVEGGG